MTGSPFAMILRAAVEKTPHAIGGAFAAADGEMVDAFATSDPLEWAIFTAHYGVVLGNIQRLLATWHFGDAKLVVFEHGSVDVLIGPVSSGYYALLAVSQPAPLAAAMHALDEAVGELRREMM
jgi:hypothetical protein